MLSFILTYIMTMTFAHHILGFIVFFTRQHIAKL